MKEWMVVSMVVLACAVLFAACAPIKTYECPDGVVVDDLVKCQAPATPPPVETPPAEPPTPPSAEAPPAESSPLLPEKVVALFKKAETRVSSFKYNYQGPPHETEYYTVYIKGDKMRVDLPKGADEIRSLNYDTVYIDLAADTGRAFCERDRNLCKGTDSIVITPSDYFFKTPFDWIKEIDGGVAGDTMQVDGRQALKLTQGNLTAWIDTYSGLPILIYIGEDTKSLAEQRIKYEYKGLSINSVVDADLMHQTTP